MTPFDYTGPSALGREFQAPAQKIRDDYPQKAYYWRRKAGLTGTRQNPKRQWRNDHAKTNPDD